MNKPQALAKLKGIAAQFDEVVFQPEHPFVLNGPDVLIHKRGTVLAIYFPSKIEWGNPSLLLARLAPTRLAYPFSVAHVLITTSEMRLREVEVHFDFSLHLEELNRLSPILEQWEGAKQFKPQQELRKRAFQISHFLSEEGLKAFENNRDSVSSRSVKDAFHYLRDELHLEIPQAKSIGGKRAWSLSGRSRIRASGRSGFSWIDSHLNQKSRWSGLHRRFTESLLFTSALDQGVPYPNDNRISFLITDCFPTTLVDPELSLRAMGFMGICFLPPAVPETWAEVMSGYDSLLGGNE